MLKFILEGISLGLFLSILVGPLLVTLINTSIKNGVNKSIVVAAGIWLSDLIIIVALFNLSHKMEIFFTEERLKILALICSVVFTAVGLIYLIKNNAKTESKIKTPNTYFWQFVKGFLINTVNPFTFVFWTSLGASHFVIHKYPLTNNVVFFSSIFAVIILTDLLKVFLADKIGQVLKTNFVYYLQLISAIIFIVSGGYIFWKFY